MLIDFQNFNRTQLAIPILIDLLTYLIDSMNLEFIYTDCAIQNVVTQNTYTAVYELYFLLLKEWR